MLNYDKSLFDDMNGGIADDKSGHFNFPFVYWFG